MRSFVIALGLILAVAAAPAFAALKLFEDNFDSNATTLSGWKRSSTTYVTRNTGSYKNGLASLKVAYNANALVYVKTSPFKNMVLTFKMAATGLAAANKLVCEVWTGTAWSIVATLADGSDNGVFRSYTASISNRSVLQFRFRMVGTLTTHVGYVEDVLLSGDRI